jgi:hypothetical protein
MQVDDTRHRQDGSMDIDFYRAGARQLRAEAIQDLTSQMTSYQAALIMTLSAFGIGVAGIALLICAALAPWVATG